eukprot:6201655-Alexandrium_andersonii.AAC.1
MKLAAVAAPAAATRRKLCLAGVYRRKLDNAPTFSDIPQTIPIPPEGKFRPAGWIHARRLEKRAQMAPPPACDEPLRMQMAEVASRQR